MIILALLCLLLVAAAFMALAGARRAERGSGLPAGKLLYSDTGFPLGRVAPIVLGRQGERQEQPLLSQRLNLVGRPDYLVETDEGVVPVEAKSARCPAGGVPHASHVMQLAAYCLLVEDTLGARVPYGVVRYSDREVRVDFTPEVRERLLALLEEMRAARAAEEVHRSHEEPLRCARCSFRDNCDESLAGYE